MDAVSCEATLSRAHRMQLTGFGRSEGPGVRGAPEEIIQQQSSLFPLPGDSQEAPRFQSFFMGGFECATHIRRDRRRLDLLAATRHDTRAAADYALLQTVGIRTVRDGLRWHRIEQKPGTYDWSSFLPMLRAAHETGTEVLWDLCHWGVPDWLDPFSPEFPAHFERYARAAAEQIASERARAGVSGTVYLCPINEISFWSWVGGDMEHFAPFGRGRGRELKRQLAAASIRAIRAVRQVLPGVRLLQVEPLIQISPGTRRATTVAAAGAHHAAQFEAWDMIAGRLAAGAWRVRGPARHPGGELLLEQPVGTQG